MNILTIIKTLSSQLSMIQNNRKQINALRTEMNDVKNKLDAYQTILTDHEARLVDGNPSV